MRFGIIVFPGTWSDGDCGHALGTVLEQDCRYVWHEETNLTGFDAVILPGGFSYGDYLRAGAIARFSPVMRSVDQFARKGGLVMGICNGFQILCEMGLLPGVLMRNNHLQYRCEWTHLRVERSDVSFTLNCTQGQILHVPISHGEGNYFLGLPELATIERRGQILFRYSTSNGEVTAGANPNGSINNIAGIINSDGNVLGMMPHPERCVETVMGGVDGLEIFRSILRYIDSM